MPARDPLTGTELRDVDPELLAEIVQHALFGADAAVIGRTFRTGAEQTRAAVTAAFRLAARNGLVILAPRQDWPEYINLNGAGDR